MPRLRLPEPHARTAHAAASPPPAAQAPRAVGQRPTAPATALVALLFGLAVPGAHAASIGNAHSAAVGASPPPSLAFAQGSHARLLASGASAPGQRASGASTRVAAGGERVPSGTQAGQDDELAFNSTLTLAGVGLLCLVVHRRHASSRRA